jgi:hypothetical protein
MQTNQNTDVGLIDYPELGFIHAGTINQVAAELVSTLKQSSPKTLIVFLCSAWQQGN